MFRATLNTSTFQNITQFVRILLPPPVWIGTKPGHANPPSVLTTRATRKTTRFGQRDAKCNAAGAMHRVAWALQSAKGTGQKREKPWENQVF